MSPRSQRSVRDAFRSAEISQILAEFFLGEILFKHIFVHNNQCEFFALSAGPFYALIVRLFTKKKNVLNVWSVNGRGTSTGTIERCNLR